MVKILVKKLGGAKDRFGDDQFYGQKVRLIAWENVLAHFKDDK